MIRFVAAGPGMAWRSTVSKWRGRPATTVRTTLTLVLLAFTVLFLLGLVVISGFETHRNRMYAETLRSAHARFFRDLLQLKGASLAALSVDYTYWDELVAFVSTGDRKWAKENLDTALSTFDADGIWIYRPDASRVYATAAPNYRSLAAFALPPQVLRYLYAHGPFSHFYVSTASGIVEMRGATIQPTSDPGRTTVARGYLLAGRVWDRAYLRDLSNLSIGEVRLVPVRGPSAPPRAGPWTVIRVSETLNAWDGTPLAVAQAQATPGSLATFGRQVRVQFLLLTLFGLGMIGLLTASVLRWVTVPLGLISEALRTGSPGPLERLERDRTEFGRVAALVRKFFAQSALVAEISKRTRAETELRASEERYRDLVQNASEIVLTRDLAGRVTSLNPAGLRLLGYTADEATDLTMQQIIAAEDHAQIIAREPGQEFDAPPSVEADVVTKDGRRVTLEWGLRPMRANGALVGVQAIGRDITARKDAESRARREAARTALLLQAAGRLNATLDPDTVFEELCTDTATALDVPTVAVRLWNPERRTLDIVRAVGLAPDCHAAVRPTRAIIDRLVGHERVVVLPAANASFEGRDTSECHEAVEIHSAAMAALERNGTVIGSLDIYALDARRQFSDEELALLRGFADQSSLAIANARSLQDAERRSRHLQALRTIDVAISGSTDMHVVLNVLLDEVLKQLQVDAADILLLNAYTQTLEPAAGRGLLTPTLRHEPLRVGEGHAGRAALTREVVHLRDLREAPGSPLRKAMWTAERFVAYYAVPLIAKGVVKGVLEVFHRTPLDVNEEWRSLLQALAGQGAIAIDGATLFNDLQRSNVDLLLAYDTTLEGWSRALELRDEETEGHTQRVTVLTLRLARAMGIADIDLAHIRRGALLHDIGKMAVPDAILRKPGALTDEEWAVMRRHPSYAYELLAPIAYLRPSLDIPYCHHELWDGSGYPRGLRGDAIPIAARIFTVVDVWDALRSDRPYRRGWSAADAKAYVLEHAGTKFDPEVVDAFLRLDVD